MQHNINDILTLAISASSVLIIGSASGCYQKTGGGLYFILPILPLLLSIFTVNEQNIKAYTVMLFFYAVFIYVYFVIWYDHKLKKIIIAIKGVMASEPYHLMLRYLGDLFFQRMVKTESDIFSFNYSRDFLKYYAEKNKYPNEVDFTTHLPIVVYSIYRSVLNCKNSEAESYFLEVISHILIKHITVYLLTAGTLNMNGLNATAKYNIQVMICAYGNYYGNSQCSFSDMSLFLSEHLIKYGNDLETA